MPRSSRHGKSSSSSRHKKRSPSDYYTSDSDEEAVSPSPRYYSKKDKQNHSNQEKERKGKVDNVVVVEEESKNHHKRRSPAVVDLPPVTKKKRRERSAAVAAVATDERWEDRDDDVSLVDRDYDSDRSSRDRDYRGSSKSKHHSRSSNGDSKSEKGKNGDSVKGKSVARSRASEIEAEAGPAMPEAEGKHASEEKKSSKSSEFRIQDELRNLELERELENRILRRKEEVGDRDRWREDDREKEEKLHSTRESHHKEEKYKGKQKDEKYRSSRYKEERKSEDKPIRAEKYKEERKSEDKPIRAEKYKEEKVVEEKPKSDRHKEARGKDDRPKEERVKDERHRDQRNKDDKYRDLKGKDEKIKLDKSKDERVDDICLEVKDRDDKYRDGNSRDDRYKDGNIRDDKHKDAICRDDKHKDGNNRDNKHKEGSSKEDKHKEGNSRDDKYKEGTGRDDKEGNSRDDKYKEGTGRDDKYKEGTGRDDKYKEGTGRDDKNKEGHGRDERYKEGNGRDDKYYKEGTGRDDKYKEGNGRDDKYFKEGTGRDDKQREGSSKDDKHKEGNGKDDNKHKEGNSKDDKYKEGSNRDDRHKEINSGDDRHKEINNREDRYKDGNNRNDKYREEMIKSESHKNDHSNRDSSDNHYENKNKRGAFKNQLEKDHKHCDSNPADDSYLKDKSYRSHKAEESRRLLVQEHKDFYEEGPKGCKVESLRERSASPSPGFIKTNASDQNQHPKKTNELDSRVCRDRKRTKPLESELNQRIESSDKRAKYTEHRPQNPKDDYLRPRHRGRDRHSDNHREDSPAGSSDSSLRSNASSRSPSPYAREKYHISNERLQKRRADTDRMFARASNKRSERGEDHHYGSDRVRPREGVEGLRDFDYRRGRSRSKDVAYDSKNDRQSRASSANGSQEDIGGDYYSKRPYSSGNQPDCSKNNPLSDKPKNSKSPWPQHSQTSKGSMQHRVPQFNARPSAHLPPPPPFRPGVDNPAVLGPSSNGFDDGQRDHGRADWNARNWNPQPHAPGPGNMYMPFHHHVAGHPSGHFQNIGQHPGMPFFRGLRPHHDMGFGMPYPMWENGDGNPSHHGGFGWQRQVDDVSGAPFHGSFPSWDGYGEEHAMMGHRDWYGPRQTTGFRNMDAPNSGTKGQKMEHSTNNSNQHDSSYNPGEEQLRVNDAQVQEEKVPQSSSIHDIDAKKSTQMSTPAKPMVKVTYESRRARRNNEEEIKYYLSKIDLSTKLAGEDLSNQCNKILGTQAKETLYDCNFEKQDISGEPEHEVDMEAADILSSLDLRQSFFPVLPKNHFQQTWEMYKSSRNQFNLMSSSQHVKSNLPGSSVDAVIEGINRQLGNPVKVMSGSQDLERPKTSVDATIQSDHLPIHTDSDALISAVNNRPDVDMSRLAENTDNVLQFNEDSERNEEKLNAQSHVTCKAGFAQLKQKNGLVNVLGEPLDTLLNNSNIRKVGTNEEVSTSGMEIAGTQAFDIPFRGSCGVTNFEDSVLPSSCDAADPLLDEDSKKIRETALGDCNLLPLKTLTNFCKLCHRKDNILLNEKCKRCQEGNHLIPDLVVETSVPEFQLLGTTGRADDEEALKFGLVGFEGKIRENHVPQNLPEATF